MVLSTTKVKLTIGQSVIELEGSEEFVEKHWEELKLFISQPTISSQPKQPLITPKERMQGQKTTEKVGKERKPLSYTPIPINLKGDDKSPALKKFYEEKSPENNQEIITLFAYYLNKYCNISNMQMGHAVSCYNEVGERKPSNIYSLCGNARDRKAYLAAGDEPYTFKITIQGENLVEHDLPRKTEKE